MSVGPSNSHRSPSLEPEPSAASELVALLWVIATLVAVLELAWWIFGRMYTS